MTGGPDSADLDRFPSLGDGDLDLLTLLEPKLELCPKVLLAYATFSESFLP